MNELILIGVFIGNMTLTSYRSVKSQTDDSPFWTSIGERVNNHGVAVSQDLLKSGAVRYGDMLYIEGQGFKVVNDTMNARMKKSIDIWLESAADEKAFDKKFHGAKPKVWVVKRHER